MKNFFTKPLICVIGIADAHLVVVVHVLSHPRMATYLLSEERFQDLVIRRSTALEEQRIPIGDELEEVIISHLESLEALEIMETVIHFGDVEGVNDNPIDLASFQHTAGFVLLCLEKLDAVP